MATHYVARELIALGHDVRQVPPAYAKPFRQGHKNDFRDAHAIAEGQPIRTSDIILLSIQVFQVPRQLQRLNQLDHKSERKELLDANLLATGSASGPFFP
jgi:transposase